MNPQPVLVLMLLLSPAHPAAAGQGPIPQPPPKAKRQPCISPNTYRMCTGSELPGGRSINYRITLRKRR